jgi:uncharacterized membrane protein YagU involved in acid resistance
VFRASFAKQIDPAKYVERLNTDATTSIRSTVSTAFAIAKGSRHLVSFAIVIINQTGNDVRMPPHTIHVSILLALVRSLSLSPSRKANDIKSLQFYKFILLLHYKQSTIFVNLLPVVVSGYAKLMLTYIVGQSIKGLLYFEK